MATGLECRRRGEEGDPPLPSLKVFDRLDDWLRRRIRLLFWRHWKRYQTRIKEMVRRGLSYTRAKQSAGNGRGPWWNSKASHMNQAVPTKELRRLGCVSILDEIQRLKCSTG